MLKRRDFGGLVFLYRVFGRYSYPLSAARVASPRQIFCAWSSMSAATLLMEERRRVAVAAI
jgi:hypothetical protein